MSTPRSWEPKWPELPPVAPLDRTVPLPVVELTEEERERRRRDYREKHEKHVRGAGMRTLDRLAWLAQRVMELSAVLLLNIAAFTGDMGRAPIAASLILLLILWRLREMR